LTSLINFAAINENFPVAGQDNDTQVFRDNFDTIKTNFSAAKTEITDLQDNTARKDQDNDFLYNVVGSLTLQDSYLRKKDYGAAIVAGTQDISFKQAMYHIVKFGANTSLSFSEFPTGAVDITGLGQIGKATLELYGNGSSPGVEVDGWTVTFVTSGGTVIKKSPGFPATLKLLSATNPKFIEVWRHSATVIFLNYLGEYT
jgi:hypothetical protein